MVTNTSEHKIPLYSISRKKELLQTIGLKEIPKYFSWTSKTRFEKLLSPFQIRHIKLRNRIVKAPAAEGFLEKEDLVTEKLKDFYEAIAKGGVGMIITAGATVDYPLGSHGPPAPIIMSAHSDECIPGFSELVQVIHKHGCPTFMQIAHVGPAHHLGLQPVAASTLPDDKKPVRTDATARELTIVEIEELVGKFANAAERGQKAGYDGVELHCGHAYLINSFLSRAWNKRHDAYGCQDLQSRTRFAVEIIREIKKRLGQDYPVGVRLNGMEWGVEGCITSKESQGIARILEGAGVDYIHVTGYGYGPYAFVYHPEQILYPAPPKFMRPLVKKLKKPGVLVEAAEAIKKVVSIPVIGVGRLGPELGEWLLQKNKVDLVGMNRRLFADPELPNKLASGRVEDIAPCTGCHECSSFFAIGEPIRCRINAALGREREYAIELAEKKKRVMVVGGGPGGMEAARVAALRGHEVSLYEREPKLGGLIPLAALIRGLEIEDFPAIVHYFRTQITKLGIKIHLGKEVTPALVEEIKPEVVILAMGGTFTIPKIPGINRPNVLSSLRLHQKTKRYMRFLGPKVLRWLTKFYLPLGKRVVVVGGLMEGFEVAEFLVKRGRKVTIVETSDQLGKGIPALNKTRLYRWLLRKKVNILTEVTYKEVIDNGLILTTKGEEVQTVEADTILVAMHPGPNTEFFKMLEGKVPEVYLIGDAREPGRIIDTIADGSRIARII
jgi:2,4-dienoyl-CoA reductase (NADPH2)